MVFLVYLATAAFLVLLIANVAKGIFKTWKYRRAINKIPGPKTLPFIGMSLEMSKLEIEDIASWHLNHFSRFKNGIWKSPTTNGAIIGIGKPNHFEVILSDGAQIMKSRFVRSLNIWLGEGLVTSIGAKWNRDRKLLTPVFHYNVLGEFSKTMYEKAKILNECLVERVMENPTKPVDILPLAKKCSMEIIFETTLGTKLNCQKDSNNVYYKAVQSFLLLMVERAFKFWLKWDWLYFKTDSGKKALKAIETMHMHSNNAIQEKKKKRIERRAAELSQPMNDDIDGTKKSKAFLDILLDMNENEQAPLSDQEIRGQIDTFIIAGHDSTASAISWAIFCLGNHPDIQQKLQYELDEVCGNLDVPISKKDLPKLKYLEMIVKETLRIYPSAPIIARLTTKDLEIDGYTIPQGTDLSMSILALHRDPDVWPEPEKFDPERFTPERSKNRHSYAFMPFSAGPRNCIGQKFAMMEMKIVLAALFRKWSFESVCPMSNMKMYMSNILQPNGGVLVHLTPRQKRLPNDFNLI